MPHRSTNDAGSSGELTVPMAWLYAEYIADELLRTGDLMPPTSFEYRAGRDALALTIFLSDADGELSGIRVISQLETWLSLTAYDQPWQDWVSERMDRLEEQAFEAGGVGPDLDLARVAWTWLQETELLAPDLDAALLEGAAQGEDDGPKVWTPAWQLGLPLGHLAIHLF
ncbi:hypothetical protein [Streptomyces sp. NBC_01304]|uniref:hypothetical protein n=1 Tax=Streptomyces sp. NBC_01304 TaxID=2903818 RepID=UPI002E1331E0|nr:hypothetical protein OG430_08135 [Streptomyces sp. NBC_01304]